MNRHIVTGAVFAVLACAIIAPPVMAQGPMRMQISPPTPESRVARIEEGITLTPEQRTRILDIYDDMSSGRGGFMMLGGLLPKVVQDVLTDEQVEEYNAYTVKQQVDRRIMMMDQALGNITADQKARIVPVLEKEISALNALMTSMMAQGPGGDFQGMRDDMSSLRAATTTSLEAIFSVDQMKQYNEMPQGRGMGGGMRGQ